MSRTAVIIGPDLATSSGDTMRRVIQLLERWHVDYLDDASNQFEWDQLRTSDALLLGRRTYEGWPGAEVEQGGVALGYRPT